MPTWQAIVDGTTYELSDSNPFKLLSATGIGNAPVRRLEERGPLQDGVTDIGYRLDPRIINLEIAVRSTSLSTADTNRDTLSRIFSPVGGRKVQLKVTRDDSSVRQIDCYTVGMLDMPAEMGQRVLAFQRVGVQLKAPNPVWYDPTPKTIAFAPGSASVPSDWYLGYGLVPGTQVLTYATTPAIGQLGTAGSGTITTWSIMTRADLKGTAASRALWSMAADGDDTLVIGPGTATINGTVVYKSTFPDYHAFTSSEGTATYWVLHDSKYISVWRDSTMLDTSPEWNASLSGTVIRWRDRGAGVAQFTGTISHAAVFAGSLTAGQRSAVQSAVSGEGTAILGTASISGAWDDYPFITLYGPMNNPRVYNLATDEELNFQGGTIAANEQWAIDTSYGNKTATSTAGTTILDKLSDASDLATFHLAPGNNAIQVTHTGGTTSASTVSISYYDRFLGL
jgi:hypothetical protein